MPITYETNAAVLADLVSVDEAEGLLQWLQATPGAPVDLAACTHLHAANLQVLMAAAPTISAWPADDALAGWLRSALGAPPAHPHDSSEGA